MGKKLSINLRQFNEEETPEQEEDFSKYIGENGDLDVDSLVNDYKEPTSNEEENHQEDSSTETEEEEETEGDGEGDKESPTQEKNTPDQAFAEMRRRNEANEPLAKWVKEVAQQQGFNDPNDLISAFEQKKLEQEAKQAGVPPDVYQRLNELEKENKQKDETMYRERFNSEVAAAKDKHNLDDNQLNEVFRFMGQKGFVDENGQAQIPFEDAYILANKDNMIEKAKEDARQEYLKEKQQQQNASTPNAGTSTNDKQTASDELDYSKEGIFKTLERMGIDYE